MFAGSLREVLMTGRGSQRRVENDFNFWVLAQGFIII